MSDRNHIPAPLLPSNTKFGWFFAAIFSAAAGYATWKGAQGWAVGLTILALSFAALTLFFPRALSPLNRAWYQLGILLGKIVSPIVMGIIFFVMITPISIITRLCGRDVLRLKPRQTESYWVTRTPAGPEPESFKQQF